MIGHRFGDGILLRSVTRPANTFGGPESDEPRQEIRGLITPFRSENTIVGGLESSTGGSRGGRDKVTVEAILYAPPDITINDSDRVTDRDGTEYSVVGTKGGPFGKHQVAYLERVV